MHAEGINKNNFTCFTRYARESWRTGARVHVDSIGAGSSVVARFAGTLVDVCGTQDLCCILVCTTWQTFEELVGLRIQWWFEQNGTTIIIEEQMSVADWTQLEIFIGPIVVYPIYENRVNVANSLSPLNLPHGLQSTTIVDDSRPDNNEWVWSGMRGVRQVQLSVSYSHSQPW